MNFRPNLKADIRVEEKKCLAFIIWLTAIRVAMIIYRGNKVVTFNGLNHLCLDIVHKYSTLKFTML